MHPAFLISELMEQFLLHIDSKADLCRLARVSKHLKNPALDALYEEIDLCDVLRCLPRDLWDISWEGGRNKYLTLDFKRRMLPGDWELLAMYTSRVQRVHSRNEWSSTWIYFSDNVVDALSACPLPSGTLFPKLYFIHVSSTLGTDVKIIHSIALASSPTNLLLQRQCRRILKACSSACGAFPWP